MTIFIVTHVFPFQALLKRRGAAELAGADAGGRGRSGEAVDSEATRIVTETPAGPEGPIATEGGSTDRWRRQFKLRSRRSELSCVC
jgi:hypothetical protein